MAANDVAREVVEAAGFEVFDTFSAALHALPEWYDEGGKDNQHSDVISDLITHMLLNQLCGREPHPTSPEAERQAPPAQRANPETRAPPPWLAAAARRGHIPGLPSQFATFSKCPPNPGEHRGAQSS